MTCRLAVARRYASFESSKTFKYINTYVGIINNLFKAYIKRARSITRVFIWKMRSGHAVVLYREFILLFLKCSPVWRALKSLAANNITQRVVSRIINVALVRTPKRPSCLSWALAGENRLWRP